MKRFQISLAALIVAVACFAFTNAKKSIGIGEGCEETLFYFKLLSTQNRACNAVTLASIDFSGLIADDGDNTPEVTEFPSNSVVVSDSQPYGCEDVVQTVACAVGYTSDQLRKNTTTGKWEPKSEEIANPQCCIRRAQN